jgi:hypothetical protein
VSIVFIFIYISIFYFLSYFAMENSLFGSLFGNVTASATVVDEPPPAQLDPFKIPIKIVKRVINNRYLGDGTVHLGDHLLFIHDLGKLPVRCNGKTFATKFFCGMLRFGRDNLRKLAMLYD